MQTQTNLRIDNPLLQKARLILRALCHPLRQQMLQYMHKEGRITVTELYYHFKIEQSVASQQLAILRNQQIVNTQREGKNIYYSVNYDRIDQLHDQLRPLGDGLAKNNRSAISL